MSWSRPIYFSWPYVFKTSSRRLQDVFRTSSRHLQDVLKTSSRRLQNVFKTSSRRLQDVLKTSSRSLQDIFKTSCKDIFKRFSRHTIKFFCRDASVVYRRVFKPQNIKVSINDGFIIME